MKYCGCITDMSWKQAVMDLHPNRKVNHPDALKRSAWANQKRDIPELAAASCRHEARRVYDIPEECRPDLESARLLRVRLNHYCNYNPWDSDKPSGLVKNFENELNKISDKKHPRVFHDTELANKCLSIRRKHPAYAMKDLKIQLKRRGLK